MKKLFVFTFLCFKILNGYSQPLPEVSANKITSDLQILARATKNRTVKIGTQTWMMDNLDVVNFRNGDPILEAESNYQWAKAGRSGTPAWCYCDKSHPEFGKIYNGFAVTDPRGLAPNGWHIANEEEWNKLYDFVGGDKSFLYNISGKTGWRYPPRFATNSSKFSAVATGWRNDNGDWYDYSARITFWVAGETETCKIISAFDVRPSATIAEDECRNGNAVRCIKDN